MNEKIMTFSRIIKSNEQRLKNGEVLSVLLADGFLTIYNEQNDKGNNRIVTLVDQFDYHIDLSVNELASHQK